VASLSQGRTAAAQCGLFTHKSVPVIFEPPCTFHIVYPCLLSACGMGLNVFFISYFVMYLSSYIIVPGCLLS